MKAEITPKLPTPPRMKEVITFNSTETHSIHNIVPINDGGNVPIHHPGLGEVHRALLLNEQNDLRKTQAQLSQRVWLLAEKMGASSVPPTPIAAGLVPFALLVQLFIWVADLFLTVKESPNEPSLLTTSHLYNSMSSNQIRLWQRRSKSITIISRR
jgi:hypothetical protein